MSGHLEQKAVLYMCQCCKQVGMCERYADPYTEGLWGDDTQYWICTKCFSERVFAIVDVPVKTI